MKIRMIFGGKVRFSITGAFCEQFIDELRKRKIRLDGITSSGGVVYAEADVGRYPLIAEVSRLYGARVRITEKKGAYFRYRCINKRPGLIAGVISGVILILFLRTFVWHIEIHGNTGLSDEYLLAMLEKYGFTAGVTANDTDALNAERMMMRETDRISWINIEVNGSRADVYLNEKDITGREDIDMKIPCNIVAGRTGILVDADVNSGKLMYEKGSGFAEGSVIVSGTVSSGDTVILVHSDAKITADFFEDVEFSMDYTTVEKVPTGERFTERQLMVLGMVIPVSSSGKDTGNTVCTETVEECSIFGLKLPMKIKTNTYTSYKDVTVTRKHEDVERLLNEKLEMYRFNFLKEYEIIDSESSLEETDTGLKLCARFKLRGDIGVKKPIYER